MTMLRDDELDQALRALAHPTRRAVMRVTAHTPLPASTVAAMLGVTPALVSEHLRVLHRSGLTDRRAEGTRRLYAAVPARLDDVIATLRQRTVGA